ncbi:hypothetical protein ACLOJK_026591 [Asimina triloba]
MALARYIVCPCFWSSINTSEYALIFSDLHNMNHHTIQTVRFGGQEIITTVTDMAHVVDEWVDDIRQMHPDEPLIVGLDCEWRPHPIQWMSNKTATLQLCVRNACLIAQLFYMAQIPETLKGFLSDPNISFVGVGVGKDAEKLRDEYGLQVTSAVDIEPLALAHEDWVWYGHRRAGLKHFALGLCGLHMEKPKSVTKSDWQARVLNERQIEYACIDAYASYKLGCKLLHFPS